MRNNKRKNKKNKNLLLKQKGNNLNLVVLARSQEDSGSACSAYKDTMSGKPERRNQESEESLVRYDKNYQDSLEGLLSIYENILKSDICNGIALDVINKVAKIGFYFKKVKSIQILLDYFNKEATVKIYIIGKLQLFNVLKDDIILCNTHDSLVAYYLAQKDVEGPLYDSFCIALAKMILRNCDDLDAAFKVITNWSFFANAMFRYWLCKYICSQFLVNFSFKFDIIKYKNDITQGIEHLEFCNLLEVMYNYRLPTRREFVPDFKSLPKPEEISRKAADFIMICLYLDRKWKYLENYTSIFINEIGYEYYRNQTHLYLFTSYAQQKKWQQAIDIASKVDFEYLSTENIRVLAKCHIENGETVDHLMNLLEDTEYYKEVQALILSKELRYNEIITLIDKDTENAMECFHLGMAHFELGDYDLSFKYFDKAIKLDSNCADIYYHYGILCRNRGMYSFSIYYLEQAHHFNNCDLNTIKALVEFHETRRRYQEIIKLLVGVSEYLDDVPWIYTAIGVQYIKLNQKENSISYFKQAIACDDKYFNAYLNLAMVNYKLGFLEESINYYYQLINLDRRYEVQYLTRIGNIRLEMNQYEEAILMFQKALEVNPNCSHAIRDLLQTWLKLASNQANAEDYYNARETSQLVIDYALEILCNGNTYSFYWKMMEEALMVITKLRDENQFVDIIFYGNEILGDLGTLYEKRSIELLIAYTRFRERNVVITEEVIEFGNRMLVEICEEENEARNDYFQFYSPVDLDMNYQDWVKTFLKPSKKQSSSNNNHL